jgi:hypothetical protein
LNPKKKTDRGAGIKKKKSKCSKEKSRIIGSMTPPNTSPHANTNTVTEEKSVNGLIPNGGLGHDSTDTKNNGAHTLDTNEVTHDFQIIPQDTAANHKDLNTRNMPEDNFWNIFRWEAPLIKTNQPMLMWKVCRKGPPNRQL